MMFSGVMGRLGAGERERGRDIFQTQEALRKTGDLGLVSEDTADPLGDALTRFQTRKGLKPDGVLAPGGPTEMALKAETAAQAVADLGQSVPSLVKINGGVGAGQANQEADVRTIDTLMGGLGAVSANAAGNSTWSPTRFLTGAMGSVKGQASPNLGYFGLGTSGLGVSGLGTSGLGSSNLGLPNTPPFRNAALDATTTAPAQAPAAAPAQATAGPDAMLDHAIRSFQSANALEPDGVITPDGETIRKLDELLSPPLTAALLDPESVGGLPTATQEPVFGPYGVEYPKGGHFDADGTYVPPKTEAHDLVWVETQHGLEQVTLAQYLTHYPDRAIRWEAMPNALVETLPPYRMREPYTPDPTDPNRPRFTSEVAHDSFYGAHGRVPWTPPEEAMPEDPASEDAPSEDTTSGDISQDVLLRTSAQPNATEPDSGGDERDGADPSGSAANSDLADTGDGNSSSGGGVFNPSIAEEEAAYNALLDEALAQGGLARIGQSDLIKDFEKLQAEYNAFESNRDAYEAAAENGVSFSRNGANVDIDLGSGDAIKGLSNDQAVLFADVIAKDPAAADILGFILDGDVDPATVNDRLSGLLYIQQEWNRISSASPLVRGPHGAEIKQANAAALAEIQALAEEYGFDSLEAIDAEINRVAALNLGLDALANGHTPTEAAQVAISGLLDETGLDTATAIEIAASLLPGVGAAIAVKDMAAEIDNLAQAVEEGDTAAILASGLGAALAAAGFFPGVGAASKIAKTAKGFLLGNRLGQLATAKVIAATDKYSAQMALQRSKRQFKRLKKLETKAERFENAADATEDATKKKRLLEKQKRIQDQIDFEFPTAGAKAQFKAVLSTLTAGQQEHFIATWKTMMGQAGEANLTQTLKQAGFGVPDPDDISRHIDTGGGTRIADVLVFETPETWLGLFLRPGTTGQHLVALEHKINQSAITKRQAKLDKEINKPGITNLTRKKKGKQHEVGGTLSLRDRLDQIPFDLLEEKMRGIMVKAEDKSGNLIYGTAQIDALVNQARDIHSQSSKSQNGMTFFQFLLVVSGITRSK